MLSLSVPRKPDAKAAWTEYLPGNKATPSQAPLLDRAQRILGSSQGLRRCFRSSQVHRAWEWKLVSGKAISQLSLPVHTSCSSGKQIATTA